MTRKASFSNVIGPVKNVLKSCTNAKSISMLTTRAASSVIYVILYGEVLYGEAVFFDSFHVVDAGSAMMDERRQYFVLRTVDEHGQGVNVAYICSPRSSVVAKPVSWRETANGIKCWVVGKGR